MQITPLQCPNCGNASNAVSRDLTFGYEFACKFCGTTSVITMNQQLYVPVSGERVCVRCGKVNAAGAEFCECGAALTHTCVNPDCGRTFSINHHTCQHCGFPQQLDPNSSEGIEYRGQLALRDLTSPNGEARNRAARILARMGSRAAFAVPYLIPVLKSDPLNACRAISGIGKSAAPAVPSLAELIRGLDYNTEVEAAACNALAAIGAEAQDAVPDLIRLIAQAATQDNNAYTSVIHDAFYAVQQITALSEIEMSEPLVKALIYVLEKSPYEGEIQDACSALAAVGKKASPAREALVKVFWERPGARWPAWEALQAMDAASPEVLVELLRRRDEDIDRACGELAAMGKSAAVALPELIAILSDKRQSEFTREAARRTLESLGESAVKPILATLVDSPPEQLIKPLAITLANIGKAAVPALIEALKQDEDAVQYAAAVALGKMGVEAEAAVPALNALSGLLSFAPGEVKAAAREAVEQIEGRS